MFSCLPIIVNFFVKAEASKQKNDYKTIVLVMVAVQMVTVVGVK